MSLSTKIYTFFYGKLIGEDEYGNKYFSNKKDFKDIKAKRWVMFKGQIEASKIPPHWHAWLHRSIDEPPLNYKHKYKWQKDHKVNRTGSNEAYFPPSHPLSKSYDTNKKNNDYESWTP